MLNQHNSHVNGRIEKEPEPMKCRPSLIETNSMCHWVMRQINVFIVHIPVIKISPKTPKQGPTFIFDSIDTHTTHGEMAQNITSEKVTARLLMRIVAIN